MGNHPFRTTVPTSSPPGSAWPAAQQGQPLPARWDLPKELETGREASTVTPQCSPRVTPQRDQTRHSQGAKPRGKSASAGAVARSPWHDRPGAPDGVSAVAGEGDASVRMEPKNTPEESGQQCDPTDQKLHFLLILRSPHVAVKPHFISFCQLLLLRPAEPGSVPLGQQQSTRTRPRSPAPAPLLSALRCRGDVRVSLLLFLFMLGISSSFKEGWSCFINPDGWNGRCESAYELLQPRGSCPCRPTTAVLSSLFLLHSLAKLMVTPRVLCSFSKCSPVSLFPLCLHKLAGPALPG
ncbi:uncharacterized protein [Patagioenas fasciata]|uniref:uncharacterized protein n=1 Tax=Patagioenas fasciata TaxID=372321 RepID=UPI003A99C08F